MLYHILQILFSNVIILIESNILQGFDLRECKFKYIF